MDIFLNELIELLNPKNLDCKIKSLRVFIRQGFTALFAADAVFV